MKSNKKKKVELKSCIWRGKNKLNFKKKKKLKPGEKKNQKQIKKKKKKTRFS